MGRGGLGCLRPAHQRKERWPIEGFAPLELEWLRFAEARAVASPERKPAVIQPAPPRATKHLQEFIGAHFPLGVLGGIPSIGDQDGAEREINARGQASGGDDDAELAGFSPRLDELRPLIKGQATVMQADPLAEESVKVVARHGTLAG